MESLTFFGLSVEYFGVFQSNIVKLRSFHFGDTLEFSKSCCEMKWNSNITPKKLKDGRAFRIYRLLSLLLRRY
jgi:hypothetical protein